MNLSSGINLFYMFDIKALDELKKYALLFALPNPHCTEFSFIINDE